MDIQTRTCQKCRSQVPLADIKLFPRDEERSWLVCPACLEMLKGSGKTGQKLSMLPPSSSPKPALSKTQDITQLKASKLQYICIQCNYRFRSDPSGTTPPCPYCGSEDNVKRTG